MDWVRGRRREGLSAGAWGGTDLTRLVLDAQLTLAATGLATDATARVLAAGIASSVGASGTLTAARAARLVVEALRLEQDTSRLVATALDSVAATDQSARRLVDALYSIEHTHVGASTPSTF